MDNDFYSVLEGELYEDPGFTHDDESLFWNDAGEGGMSMAFFSSVLKWDRVSEKFPAMTLFGDKGVTPGDLQ